MKKFAFLAVLLLLQSGILHAQRRMENLGRGVVAVRTNNTVFISWRLLGLDPSGIGFNVYRSENGATATKLNTSVLTAGTNFTDTTANLTQENVYYVKPVIGGTEQTASGTYTLIANADSKPCYTVPILPGSSIHFVWVGDLDGDGEYDYVLDRIGDVSGHSKIEAYKRDGTFLWDIDYGPNSANQNNISPGSATIDVGNWDGVTVYDLDGDGKAEVITKIANGVRFGDNTTWTNSSDTKQWIAILDGETGALKSYKTIPNDYTTAGSFACSLGIGYLNGTTPSIVGKFKNRNADGSFNLMVCAFNYNGNNTNLQWKWLRGNTDAPDGHQIRIIDVDGNGTDEVCDIGYCLNGDGTVRYLLGPEGVVHGDRTQIGKLDPNRAGMQGYAVQQNNPSGLLEYYYDANTGELLWEHYGSVGDIGRGTAADVDPTHSGFEVWSFFGIYNGPTNTQLTSDPNRPYPNFKIWWDGDLLGENLHDEKIEKWNYTTSSVSRLVTCWHYNDAGGSDRNAPLFYGDINGDWREEVILRNADNSQLVIFTTNVPSTTRLYTLAHNPAYRNCMTIKGYMQSHHTDYFLGAGMSTPEQPDIYYADGGASFTANSNARTAAPQRPDNSFNIYPNPINGKEITLSLLTDNNGDAHFTLTNMQGQVIFSKTLGSLEKGYNTVNIDLSGLNIAAGTYIGNVNQNGNNHTKLVVKK
ncbi:T9SS type A sorting domain-containing protein [Flavobacterium sp. Sd200]|uniref:rhamnogalacturonan lyase family protein n=1 Tax=Flavobacterium sp. Sd200 TaxID=2692211 RepID=UPI0013682695|nr:T9SS type A sorting domain-containing protein [Flavobacterium sp. Sd200]MXN90115.1 T9SS type A sorting domain-containing protein [Flavobacterium sp. Sd200]